MAIVYKITNLLNGKSYIGQTIYDLEHRWKRHLSAARTGSKFRFHSALRKYGPDPWKKEIIFEHSDILEIRKFEEAQIIKYDLISNNGYNAKPGGCGGWIVPDEKLEDWKLKISKASSGLNNPNAGSITNEEILQFAVQYAKEFNVIPGSGRLRDYMLLSGKHLPAFFTKFRFNGSYKNLAALVENLTGLTYNQYYKDAMHKEKLKNSKIRKTK